MHKFLFMIVVFAFGMNCGISHAQNEPNLGDKSCLLWVAVHDKSKEDGNFLSQYRAMEAWSLGYLKGISRAQVAISGGENQLLKIRKNERPEIWMLAWCRINSQENISNSAFSFLHELTFRGD